MYAYLGLQNFVANLEAPLGAEDVTPAIRFDKAARLCATIAPGNHTYLVLEAPGGFEIVRVSCQFGVVVMERGQDGTAPQPFPVGACLYWKLTGGAAADIADQVMSCPKPCVVASIKSGGNLPAGTTGVPYEHRVVISGTPPFSLGQMLIPGWMVVELDAGEIRLSGVPDAPGLYNVQIPLNSCGELRPFLTDCVNVLSP